MFKISAASEYALLLVKYLTTVDEIRTLESIALETHIPLPMLRKISGKLERSGILFSKKGRTGGIGLFQKTLSVKEVLLAAGEDLSIALCSGKGTCASRDACSIAPTIRNLQRGFESILALTKL